MSTVYAPNSSFSGTVAGETFVNGQATVTDAWKLVWFAEKGYGIGSAATPAADFTLPAGKMADYGADTVTGTKTIKSGLRNVEHVVATIAEDAVYKAGEVTVLISNQTTNPGEFVLKVWTNAATPAASNEAIDVSWVAYGT
jgi:hypothetical protein